MMMVMGSEKKEGEKRKYRFKNCERYIIRYCIALLWTVGYDAAPEGEVPQRVARINVCSKEREKTEA
jgi:hypothetical protein